MKKPDTASMVDPYPRLSGGTKDALRVSSNTTIRHRAPTNPHTASKIPNMIFDYSRQVPVWPDGDNRALVEATQRTGSNVNYRTMNASGRPFALGVMVGGSPEDRGTVYQRAKRAKIIK